MQAMQLSAIKPNDLLEVTGFTGDEFLIQRLQEMGINLGHEMKFVGRAPWMGPMMFRIGTTVIALRDEEALCLLLKQK